MSTSIDQIIMQFKDDVSRAFDPSAIVTLCRSIGHTWRTRELDPVATVQGFLLQVLHCNTACAEVPRLLGKPVTAEAYAQARSRLPLGLFQQLLAEVCSRLRCTIDAAPTWLGHRVWMMDGSGCSMPDTPELQKAFGQPGGQSPGCGFPVAHLMTLFHASTGMLLRIAAAPSRTHDASQAHLMHSALEANDILLADRGFCSFAHLAMLRRAGVHAVFRAHQRQIIDFRKGRMHAPPSPPFPRLRRSRGLPKSRWIKWLGRHDQVVEYFRPRDKPTWMTDEEWAILPQSIHIRELRYDIEEPGCRTMSITLVTDLLDASKYPAAELAELYATRWEIETNLRHLKETLGMDVLRTKTVTGIQKELAVFAIAYNLVRLVMLEAAALQGVTPDRISFIDALRWLRCTGDVGSLRTIRIEPRRRGRHCPRVRKRRPKAYPLMTKPRSVLTQTLVGKAVAP